MGGNCIEEEEEEEKRETRNYHEFKQKWHDTIEQLGFISQL